MIGEGPQESKLYYYHWWQYMSFPTVSSSVTKPVHHPSQDSIFHSDNSHAQVTWHVLSSQTSPSSRVVLHSHNDRVPPVNPLTDARIKSSQSQWPCTTGQSPHRLKDQVLTVTMTVHHQSIPSQMQGSSPHSHNTTSQSPHRHKDQVLTATMAVHHQSIPSQTQGSSPPSNPSINTKNTSSQIQWLYPITQISLKRTKSPYSHDDSPSSQITS